MKYLFSNFLNSEIEYQICEEYWKTKIEYLFKTTHLTEYTSYLRTTFANGKEMRDGNPIVNYYIKSLNKAFRIIQEEPEFNKKESIGAWTNKFESDKLMTSELVISLELTPKTEQITFDFIEKWLIDDYTPELMEKYISYVYESLKTKNVDRTEVLEYA